MTDGSDQTNESLDEGTQTDTETPVEDPEQGTEPTTPDEEDKKDPEQGTESTTPTDETSAPVPAADDGYTEWTSTDSLPTSGTYRLTQDVTISTTSSKYPTVTGTLVLDLAGHTITVSGDGYYAYYVNNSKASLTIQDSEGNGKITNSGINASSKTLIQVNSGSFTLEGGTLENTTSSGYALFLNSDSTAEISGGTVVNKANGGKALFLNSSSSLTMTGGEVIQESSYSSDAAIYANNGASSIEISGGKVTSATMGVYAAFTPVTVTGGTFDTESYAFQTRNTTISPKNNEAVKIKSDAAIFYSFSGSENTIEGGTFTAPALSEEYTSENESTLTISGGTFTELSSDAIVSGENTEVTISGGSFTDSSDEKADISQYLDDSCEQDESGQVLPLTKENAAAEIDGKYYKTLAGAIKNAGYGVTVKLLRSVPGSGIVIPSDSNLTIDLNNQVYTVGDHTVGSLGTETNGFQLLKDSDITFKNGTIKPGTDDAKILIQNYSNLTLENVTLDCSGSQCQYALSNNNGNTTISGKTNIIAAQGQVAFDVCLFAEYPSVSVTFDDTFTGTVDGTIEYTGKNAQTHTLTIKGNGTFTGEIKADTAYAEAAKGAIKISGGTFTDGSGNKQNVSQYLDDSCEQDESGQVLPLTKGNAAAEIDGKYYKTLAGAIEAADAGDTVKLLKDYDPDDNVLTIEGKDNLTLDLGGNTLTLQLDVKNSHLTLQNGNITAPKNTATLSGGAAVYVYGSDNSSAQKDSCVVNVKSSAMLSGYYGILVSGPTYGSNVSYGVTVNVEGTVNDPLFISGNLNNASARKDENATTINILNGAKMNNTICMNGEAVVNVYDGATVTGDDAIAVKRGQLNITGGTFTATGDKVNPADANTNGSETTGSAISVTSTYNTSGSEIDINISGGTFSSVNNAAVYLGHAKNTSNELLGYRGSLNLEISGGDFSGGSNVPSIYVAEKISADAGFGTEEREKIAEKFISGGTYTNEVREYLADEIQYEVRHTDGSFTYTETMEEAQEAAKPGDSITDLDATAENTVTLTLKYNDDATADTRYTVRRNTDVTLPTPTRSGSYEFAGWFDESGNKVTGASYRVTTNTTLTAKWTYTGSTGGSSVTRYTVSVPSDIEGGSVRVSPSRASRGQTVTITVSPDEGYELDRLVVRDADGDRIDLERKSDTKYTFEMPRGKVTVEATFTEIEDEDAIPFRDVDTDDWFYDAVVYAYDTGLMSGVSDDQFAPDATLTRAMVAQMLYSLEGKPRTGSAGYADVAFGAWYEDAVAWISSEGLMTGYSDTAFGPDDPVTREQLALILYNYADWAGYDVRGSVSLGSYIDADSASTWAVEALEWAIDAGLISGRGDGILAPAGTATRAEVAQIFMNFLENVAQ